MRKLVAVADRTAVLFLGVAAGAAIGFAFGRSGEPPASPAVIRPPVPAANLSAAKPAAGFECALPFQQHLLDTVTAGRPVTVGVFGDSFGDGVWSALYRLLPAKDRFRVLKYSQQSTGFTRYASLNLEEHAQAQLAADGPVDIAVISFGANDTQGVYSGGHAAALMSPEWQRVIGERIDRFVALMRAKGAMVYWVGLPKMRKPAFDADIAAMNDFYAARMRALAVPFMEVRPLTVDAAGEYAPYLPDPVSHERRLMRANDGIHMSMNGYVVITRALAERIKAYVGAARVRATGGVATVAGPKLAAVESPKREERKETSARDRDRNERRERDDDTAKPARKTERRDTDRREGDRKDQSERERGHEPDAPDKASAPRHGERSGHEEPAASPRREPDRPREDTPPKRDTGGKDKPDAASKRDRDDDGKASAPAKHDRDGRDKAAAPKAASPKAAAGASKPKSDDTPSKPRKRNEIDPAAWRSLGNSQ